VKKVLFPSYTLLISFPPPPASDTSVVTCSLGL
jgi:hypothetical protein